MTERIGRWPLFAFVVCFAAARGLAAEWSPDLEAALSRARAEDKPVLLHLASTSRASRALAEMLTEAEKHEPIVEAYSSFVLCRPGDTKSAALDAVRADDVEIPSVALLTPGGAWVASWTTQNLNLYMNFLALSRRETRNFAAIDRFRSEGNAAHAAFATGELALSVGQAARAREQFERAKAGYTAAGDAEHAELAQMRADFARFVETSSPMVRIAVMDHLLRQTRNASSPRSAARGWLALATLNRVSHNVPEMRRCLVKSYELAEPESDTWSIARDWLVELGEMDETAEKPLQSTIRIVAPPRATLTGRVELKADARPAVDRVAWFQDRVAVGSTATPPFTIDLDLGRTPRLHSIRAVAFDASGYAIGESEVAINDRIDAFRVSIVSPVATKVSGNVTIEADASPPAGHRIAGVELFWNAVSIGQFATPPYRATFDMPSSFGFIRAVATLDDGRSAEETRLVNSEGATEPVDVHEVAFPVTVTNRRGVRVDGLVAGDFVVTDERVAVPVTLHQKNEPSTIGLAIDSSASMKHSLLDLMEMATEFLDIAVTSEDRAFLMTFDDRPHMIHTPSSDEKTLRAAALRICPSGDTSIFDAVAFGLQQFTGMPGKRALLVLTDGFEVESQQSATACMKMAREIGVPVYVVVTPGGNMRRLGNSLSSIAASTGGAIFYAPTRADVTKVFGRIRDEVRGQYLLSFNAPPATPGIWRTIRVEVPRRRSTVRTIAGYYAR